MILSIVLLTTCLLLRLDVASGCFGKPSAQVLNTTVPACDFPRKPFDTSTYAYNLLNLTMQPQALLGQIPYFAQFRVNSVSISAVWCDNLAPRTNSAPCKAQLRHLIVKKTFMYRANSQKPASLHVVQIDSTGSWFLSYQDVTLKFTFSIDDPKSPSIGSISTDDIDDEQLKSVFSQLKVSCNF